MGRSLEILEEACGTLPHTVRKMFGGYGFFAPNGGMFAGIVTDDAIVVKLVRGPLRDEFIALGGAPWTYEGGNAPMTMHEWLVIPDGFYDDFELLGAWLAKAHRSVPAKVVKKKSAKPKEKPLAAKARKVASDSEKTKRTASGRGKKAPAKARGRAK